MLLYARSWGGAWALGYDHNTKLVQPNPQVSLSPPSQTVPSKPHCSHSFPPGQTVSKGDNFSICSVIPTSKCQLDPNTSVTVSDADLAVSLPCQYYPREGEGEGHIPMCTIRAKIMKSETWRIKKGFEFLILLIQNFFFH